MILTKEDLLAIGQLIDEKLKPVEERLDRLEARMDRIEERMDRLEASVERLEARVERLEASVERLEARMDSLETRVDRLEARMDSLEERVGELEKEVTALKQKVGDLETQVVGIKVYLDTRMEPRMKNLESTYLDTYKRYCKEIDRMPQAYSDVDMLKGVVVEHSRTLARHEQLITALQA